MLHISGPNNVIPETAALAMQNMIDICATAVAGLRLDDEYIHTFANMRAWQVSGLSRSIEQAKPHAAHTAGSHDQIARLRVIRVFGVITL